MHPSSAAGRSSASSCPAGFPTRPAARSRPLSTRPARPAPGPVRPAAGPVRPAAGPVQPATSAAAQPLGRPAPRTPAVHQPQGPACGGSRSHGPRKPVDHSRNIKATRRGPEWLPRSSHCLDYRRSRRSWSARGGRGRPGGRTATAGGGVTPPVVRWPERLARAALSRVVEPGELAVGRLVAAHGAEAAWSAVRSRDPAVGAAVLALTRARVDAARPEQDLAALDAWGGRLVCPGDDEWPRGADDLGDARPLGLWVRGRQQLGEACGRAVAIVGARAATGYGEHVAGEWSAQLAEAGRAVLSGAAYGIDGAAHRGALAVAGETIAVLACGVDVPYPRGHDALLARIAEQGLVVSEWPPGCAPMRHRFL